ncbi:hypothetical protein BDBG_04671 [Blastomyces gilchristii SLH14081]|uniref:Zn(2)-C6 fungal-type domain-containing protein n=1 Tax=Blastomyces gilchristii (strain SLH14081) TaxID=559298 RepID=A0A179UQ07_BLAGS|nr:uncharacterized protein BDBG_04671 [Blastomyces gilchristii SLH14081]OAT09111.1 hypothetical protein BDBG_04671 [Blastomyces gilchristii SLH14081]
MAPSPNNPEDINNSPGDSLNWPDIVDFGQESTNDPQLSTATPRHDRDSPEQEQKVPVTGPAARAPKKAQKRIFSETDTQEEPRDDSKKHKLNIDQDVNVYNIRQHVETALKVERLRARKKEERRRKKPTDVKEHTEYKNTEDEATEDELESEDELQENNRQEDLSEWGVLGVGPPKSDELEAIEEWHKKRIESDRIARDERRKKSEEEENKAKEGGEDKDKDKEKKKEKKKKEPRTIEACNHCKDKKIKCSANRKKCKPCRDAKKDCFFSHPALGEPWKREWPVHRYGEVEAERDYYRKKVKHLELLVDFLQPRAVLGPRDKRQIDEWETKQEAADIERKCVMEERRTSRRKYKQKYLERKKEKLEKLEKPKQKGGVIEDPAQAGTQKRQLNKQHLQRQPPSSAERPVINDPNETQVSHVPSYTQNPYSNYAEPPSFSEQWWAPLPTDRSDDELDAALTNPVTRRRPQRQPQSRPPRARPSGQRPGQARPTVQSIDSQATRDTGNPHVPSYLEFQPQPQQQPPYGRREGAQPEQTFQTPSPPFDDPSRSSFL